MITKLHTAGEPLLRILAVLDGAPMSYDSLTNRGDYLSPHYLAEVLPRELAKKDGLRAQWARAGQGGNRQPGQGTAGAQARLLRRPPRPRRFRAARRRRRPGHRGRAPHPRQGRQEAERRCAPRPGFRPLRAVSWTSSDPVRRSACRSRTTGRTWSRSTAAGPPTPTPRSTPTGPGGCSTRSRPASNERITAGAKLARWLFDTDEPPRYVLLLHGGVVILADRLAWAEGRYLAVSLDTAIDRADQAELETIAALFSADVLQPPAEGGTEQLAHWVDESRKHAVGVSGELREGLRESVQIIANEVLDRIRSHGLAARGHRGTRRPGQGAGPGRAAVPVPDPVPAVRRGPPGARHPARRRPGLHRGLQHAAPRRTGRPPPHRRGSAHRVPPVRVAGPAVPHGQQRSPGAREREHGGAVRGRRAPVRVAQGRPVRAVEDPADRPHPRPPLRRRSSPARHPAAGRGPVQGAAPADARQGQRAEGQEPARRVHLLRPARHQPARRGLRGADVLHRVHRRRGTVRGRQEGRPVRRLLDDPRVQGPFLRRRRIRQGEGRERVPDRRAGPVPARVVRLPAGRPGPADQRLLLHAPVADQRHRPARPGAADQGGRPST